MKEKKLHGERERKRTKKKREIVIHSSRLKNDFPKNKNKIKLNLNLAQKTINKNMYN